MKLFQIFSFKIQIINFFSFENNLFSNENSKRKREKTKMLYFMI